MMLSKKRITTALIRLRICAVLSGPLLFTNLRRQVFLRRGPITIPYTQAPETMVNIYPVSMFCSENIVWFYACYMYSSVAHSGSVGRASDWESKGCWFESHRRGCNCVLSLNKTLYCMLCTSSTEADRSRHD